MKRNINFIKIGAVAFSFGVIFFAGAAQAQMFPYPSTTAAMTGSSSAPTSTMAATTSPSSTPVATDTASTTIISPTSTLPLSPQPSGFMEMDNLVVDNVSGSLITAGGSDISTCTAYAMATATIGVSIPCPTASSFAITVTDATQLLLKDRTQAFINSFSAGDQINAFGFYDGMGNLQANIVRNLTEPTAAVSTQLQTGTMTKDEAFTALQNIAQEMQTIVNEGAQSSTFATSVEAGELTDALSDLQNMIVQMMPSSTAAASTTLLAIPTTTMPASSTSPASSSSYPY